MRLLDRYLLRELWVPLLYCFTGFLVFWISFEFAGDVDDFQKSRLTSVEITRYYAALLPKLLVEIVAPISFLLALLYAVTQHSRHQELTAMRAAGIGLWRLCLPYWMTGLLLSAVSFWLNEAWVPGGVERADRILRGHTQSPAGEDPADWVRTVTFQNHRDRRLWLMDAFNKRSLKLSRPDVVWNAADGGRRKLVAAAAAYHEGAWVFDQAQLFSYDTEGNLTSMLQTNRLVVAEFDEVPEHIRNEIRVHARGSFREAKKLQFSIREIEDYLALRGSSLAARDTVWLKTRLYERYASPFTCLVVALIAIPFAAPSSRRNAYVGVASSLFIGFSYFVLKELSLAAGVGGHLEPWLAAWLPNLAFGLLGAWLLLRVR
ncbi:MAG: YjgP/YjgQ family permease [Verrucomicrobia bacterium]|nr:YjgP/YjgQ family permease [Verrucomicrobiota bacterium]